MTDSELITGVVDILMEHSNAVVAVEHKLQEQLQKLLEYASEEELDSPPDIEWIKEVLKNWQININDSIM